MVTTSNLGSWNGHWLDGRFWGQVPKSFAIPSHSPHGLKMGGPGVECILEGVLEGNMVGMGERSLGTARAWNSVLIPVILTWTLQACLEHQWISILDVFCQSIKQKTNNAHSWAQFQASRIFPNNIEQPQLGWCWFYPWHLFAQVDLAMVCELRPAWC